MSSEDEIKRAAATVAGIFMEKVDQLFEVYSCLDHGGSGLVGYKDICKIERISNSVIVSDEEIVEMETWIADTIGSPIDTIEFCRVYTKAPKKLRLALFV